MMTKSSFQVTYDIGIEVKGQEVKCTCQKVALVDLTVVDPFKMITQIMSTQVGVSWTVPTQLLGGHLKTSVQTADLLRVDTTS